MSEIQVWSLGQEDLQEKGMATHSSILAWRIPWQRSQWARSIGSQRLGHDWSTVALMHIRVRANCCNRIYKTVTWNKSVCLSHHSLQMGSHSDGAVLLHQLIQGPRSFLLAAPQSSGISGVSPGLLLRASSNRRKDGEKRVQGELVHLSQVRQNLHTFPPTFQWL